MTTKNDRRKPSKAALDRVRILTVIADGKTYTIQTPDRSLYDQAYRAIRNLEGRGLVEVDRSCRPIQVQVVYPEAYWLMALDILADQAMRRAEATRAGGGPA